MQKSYKHYYKKKGRKFNLFESPYWQQIIPDYIQWEGDGKTPISVADAKYIQLDKGSSYVEERATAIYYKTITYMYRLGVSKGFLFYPSSDTDAINKMKIKNTDSHIIKLPLKIPIGVMSFNEFCSIMKESEAHFIDVAKNHNFL